MHGVVKCKCLLIQLVLQSEDLAEQSPLGVYKQYFEVPFLERTAQYYRAESSAFLADNPVTEYMKKAAQRLEEEQIRMRK